MNIGCLLMPVVLLLFLVGAVVAKVLQVLRILRGSSASQGERQSQSTDRRTSAGRASGRAASSDSPSKQKVFSDDEGEYVDYEEVK